jgi:cysteine synthase
MSTTSTTLTRQHIIGGVVTCGAILGIASMIHPTDSSAIPVGLEGDAATSVTPGATSSADHTQGLLVGTLEGRGFEAELVAGTPEATVHIYNSLGERLGRDLTLVEFLLREGAFVGDELPASQEAWPEAVMEVDVPMDAW